MTAKSRTHTDASVTPAPWLALTTLILSLLGLLFVYNASVAEAYATFGDQFHFLRQHSVWLGVGTVVGLIGYLLPLSFWKRIAPLMYLGTVLLLIATLIPGIGTELNGARRWLFIGSYGFQPIEIMKVSLIMYFASWLSEHQKLLPFLATTALPTILVLLQPDLGSILVLVSVAMSLFFVAGGDLKAIFGIGGMGAVLVLLLILSSPYRRERLTTFLNPTADPLGAGFHTRQITLALGRGGWFGQGIGKSQQKYLYIPEASTDSIFAILSEEVGFVGSIVILGLIVAWLQLGIRAAHRHKENSFAFLLGWGIVLWIAAQSLLNLAAVVILVPLTGLPLPFFSYGGTALVMTLFASGLLLNVASREE